MWAAVTFGLAWDWAAKSMNINASALQQITGPGYALKNRVIF